MKQPHYVFTPPGSTNINGSLVGDMVGPVRRIQLTFYTKDHALADAQYDALLELMKEEGWNVQLVE